MKHFIIGIRVGAQDELDVFYIGRDGVKFREVHSDLVAKNKDGSRFYQIQHPLLTPLQNIPNNTEDHPDHVAALARRQEMAAAPEATPGGTSSASPQSTPKSLLNAQIRFAELSKMKVKDLAALATRIAACGQDIIVPASGATKADFIGAIMQSEGLEVAAKEEAKV